MPQEGASLEVESNSVSQKKVAAQKRTGGDITEQEAVANSNGAKLNIGSQYTADWKRAA